MIGWYGGHMYNALKCSQEGSASNPGPSSSPALSSVTLGGGGEKKDYKQPAIDWHQSTRRSNNSPPTILTIKG